MKALITQTQFHLMFHSGSVKYDIPITSIYVIKMIILYLWHMKLDHHLIHILT
jgi:hypothetical protein